MDPSVLGKKHVHMLELYDQLKTKIVMRSSYPNDRPKTNVSHLATPRRCHALLEAQCGGCTLLLHLALLDRRLKLFKESRLYMQRAKYHKLPGTSSFLTDAGRPEDDLWQLYKASHVQQHS